MTEDDMLCALGIKTLASELRECRKRNEALRATDDENIRLAKKINALARENAALKEDLARHPYLEMQKARLESAGHVKQTVRWNREKKELKAQIEQFTHQLQAAEDTIKKLTEEKANLNNRLFDYARQVDGLLRSQERHERFPFPLPPVGDLKVGEIPLSTRARNALTKAGVRNVFETAVMTDVELLRIKNLSRITLNEIRRAVALWRDVNPLDDFIPQSPQAIDELAIGF